jgi:HEAT repeat protein
LALGQLKRADAVDALLESSKDELPEVRMSVVQALLAIGDPKARTRIAELAKDDPDERVRAAAGGK